MIDLSRRRILIEDLIFREKTLLNTNSIMIKISNYFPQTILHMNYQSNLIMSVTLQEPVDFLTF
jgi:hypothetical protein